MGTEDSTNTEDNGYTRDVCSEHSSVLFANDNTERGEVSTCIWGIVWGCYFGG